MCDSITFRYGYFIVLKTNDDVSCCYCFLVYFFCRRRHRFCMRIFLSLRHSHWLRARVLRKCSCNICFHMILFCVHTPEQNIYFLWFLRTQTITLCLWKMKYKKTHEEKKLLNAQKQQSIYSYLRASPRIYMYIGCNSCVFRFTL